MIILICGSGRFGKRCRFTRSFSRHSVFSRLSSGDGWRSFSLAEPDPTELIWLVEEPSHQPNETRIAMWADSREEVDRLAKIVEQAGGRVLEGPELCPDYSPDYYACFFQDLGGNRWEICCRRAEG